jgi:diadenosine tetraphosphate (Ap4A) HIT family hydrolase
MILAEGVNYMPRWTNPEEWAILCSGETCPICLDGGPADVIAELEVSWLCSNDRGPLRGYCCLTLKRHAVELHDLTEAEGSAYMRDIQKVSRALKTVTGAVKMNYDIHGNAIPHVHTHFYPRQVGDPWENTPIHGRAVPTPVYAPGEFSQFIAGLRDELAKPIPAVRGS